ncbi:GTPase of the mitochondrial inner membrane that associates with the large ribosomal subunit [Lodderomyces elongisporus]|uniref:GTPase of the mitochondrial inner membrane that associates with the large ribosomal subunit n=1 Tax=Lodderomyces elongisporus TaxID=36914 RepID=UPI002926D07C|nr:GTPase of the mitochondrial inner membrane that associates with the large ribosomal subunit [Lodderomyces elongisporus]WLF78984.1 GTPase of the mitochondrial inner membrane that associates with the large ribosomal subunit [Lodderomyces elongisporus]
MSLRRCLHYTRRLQNLSQDASIPPTSYKFHDKFPQSTANQVVIKKTITNLQDSSQTMKLTQLEENPLEESLDTNLEKASVATKPQIRNFISVADYFSGNQHHLHHVFYSNLINERSRRAQKIEHKKFIDLKIIKCSTGAGGNGCVAFFRDNLTTSGPADGGDGGSGGNVYVKVVDSGHNSLHYIQRAYVAKNGTPGKGSQLDGKNGEDVVIEVPVGTVIRWIPDPMEFKKHVTRKEGDELEDVYMEMELAHENYGGYFDDFNRVQLSRDSYKPGDGWIVKEHDREYYEAKDYFQELNKKVSKYEKEIEHEERMQDQFPLFGLDCDQVTQKPILLLRGGRGGLGNMHFITPNIRNPRFCKIGRAGITAHFLLELKLIADLGLVGLPNAGKSSLLRAISRAKQRVGDWEFTTLQPTIGVIQHRIDSEPFTVADIPGIIKGASENKGMGLDFLRHIERSGGLVFVVSLESADPTQDLKTLIDEVGPLRMKEKKVLVVATKADLSENGESFSVLRSYLNENRPEWKIVPVCAPNGENIERCLDLMSEVAKKETK